MESSINKMNGMDNLETNGNNKSVNSNGKTSLAYGLALIFILFLAIILSASFMGVFNGYEPYQQLTAAMLSVAATGVITAMLLYFQRKQQEQLNQEQRVFEEEQKDKDKERLLDTKIFEEKLCIYKEFLKKLCDVVKDKKITDEEEIELQFQISYISMHTESDIIKTVSEQVSEIVVNLKQAKPDANNMLSQLFLIADSFYKELYHKDYKYDLKDRADTKDNFRSILVPLKMIDEYEKEQKDKVIQSLKEEKEKTGKLDIKDRTRLLKAMISRNDAQQTTNGNIIVYKYYTTRMDGAYTDSNESILLFLLPDEKERKYKILIFTRQRNDVITKNLVKAIWPQEEFNPWSADKSRHIHKELSFDESDEIIAHEMDKVLQEVKAYRDEKFPL